MPHGPHPIRPGIRASTAPQASAIRGLASEIALARVVAGAELRCQSERTEERNRRLRSWRVTSPGCEVHRAWIPGQRAGDGDDRVLTDLFPEAFTEFDYIRRVRVIGRLPDLETVEEMEPAMVPQFSPIASVLSKRKSVVRMRDHLQYELAVPARILQCARRWSTDRQPAQDEGSSVECELLALTGRIPLERRSMRRSGTDVGGVRQDGRDVEHRLQWRTRPPACGPATASFGFLLRTEWPW